MPILNLHHHRKQLALKALNKHSTVEAAAKDMGITGRTLHNWKKMYGIERVNVGDKWQYEATHNIKTYEQQKSNH
jgi:hypothetical protein